MNEGFSKISAAERHKQSLQQPKDDTIIYKIMTLENFKKSFEEKYLYFNRVDGYEDDKKDSSQPEQERLLNRNKYFYKSPNYTLENKYDDLRKRAYACCFSLKKPSQEQWECYGGRDAVCLELDFGKLKSFMNSSFESKDLKICGLPNFVPRKFSKYIISEDCNIGDLVTFKNDQDFEKSTPPTPALEYAQFFDLNYGKVTYGDFNSKKISDKHLANSIEYLYFKDKSYEKKDGGELRISLMSQEVKNLVYSIDDFKEKFNFPKSLNFYFDFCMAIDSRVIVGFELQGENSYNYFQSKILKNL